MPKGRGVLSHYRGDAGQRGYSLSKENTPFGTPRERRGVFPSPPDIAGLELEELHTLRNQVRCTWLRHEPLQFATTLNRALLS